MTDKSKDGHMYAVTYVLKYDNGCHPGFTGMVKAANARQACATVGQMVKATTGRHAFHLKATRVDKEKEDAER